MEEYRKRLVLLDTQDFELIVKLAKLLPVIRMAEQVRAMAADLRADTPRNVIVDPRIGHLEMTRENLLFALSLARFAVYIVGFIYVIFFE